MRGRWGSGHESLEPFTACFLLEPPRFPQNSNMPFPAHDLRLGHGSRVFPTEALLHHRLFGPEHS